MTDLIFSTQTIVGLILVLQILVIVLDEEILMK